MRYYQYVIRIRLRNRRFVSKEKEKVIPGASKEKDNPRSKSSTSKSKISENNETDICRLNRPDLKHIAGDTRRIELWTQY